MKLGKILIIDGSYLLHRALHVESIFNLTNSEGVRTGGIFQFLRSMNVEMSKNSGYYPIVTWDAGLAERRLEVYPNYKHHADKIVDAALVLDGEPEVDEYLQEYTSQRAELIELLHSLGIPSLRFNGWEGDDLMYILSKLTTDGVVLTDDRDLIQLLSPTISISRPIAGEFLTYKEWQEEHNDPNMRKYVIAKSIVGDGSDNIPKCADGVGPKTADAIAQLMMDNQSDWIEKLKESNKKALKAFVEPESLKQFSINMELIDLSRVRITDEITELVCSEIVNNVKLPNYFDFITKLGRFEITKLDSDFIISNLTTLVNAGGIVCQD